MPSVGVENRKRVWLTGGSIVALIVGFIVGAVAHASGQQAIAGALAPIGALWVNALRMTIVPLIAAQLVASVIRGRGAAPIGRIGGISVLTFLVMLVLAGVLAISIAPIILARLQFAPEALAALRSAPAVAVQSPQPTPTFEAWLVSLVPANAFRAAAQDDLLGTMIFAIAFALAVGRMASERRALVGELSRIVADAMMTIIGWIMWVMPIAVFALAMSTASRAGVGAAQVVAVFLVLTCVVLLASTLLLYPIGAVAAGMSIRRFAVAIIPAQVVAASTRSSIASLPSMMDTAQNRLGIRPEVSSLVLPLAVSTFKLNRVISSPLQFLFLAHVYGIELSMPQVIAFVVTALVLSVSTLGIPSGGSAMRTAPLYIAAGIPIEGYLLTEAVDAIPDMFKTVMNVTGDMTAATLVNRLRRADAAAGSPAALAKVEQAAAQI